MSRRKDQITTHVGHDAATAGCKWGNRSEWVSSTFGQFTLVDEDIQDIGEFFRFDVLLALRCGQLRGSLDKPISLRGLFNGFFLYFDRAQLFGGFLVQWWWW